MSNHMDLSEIRKTIEWMTPSDGWKVQKDATGDPANLWAWQAGIRLACGPS